MMEKLKYGMKWGGWWLNAETLALDFDGPEGHYEINLEAITDSAIMLDWIFQMRTKSWATNEIMGDLLSAFQAILRPQGSLCGQGIGRKLDPTAWIKQRLE